MKFLETVILQCSLESKIFVHFSYTEWNSEDPQILLKYYCNEIWNLPNSCGRQCLLIPVFINSAVPVTSDPFDYY